MQSPVLQARPAPGQLRQARRILMDSGALPADLIQLELARSWQRSWAAGLQPCGRMPGAPHASAAQLARAQERQHELVAHAHPVMEFLFDHTRDTDSMVILAGADGMLLHALGDPQFVSRAERVALRPGATWHEHYRGTNAIGTALADGLPVVVHAAEHYLERNGFLTCAAAPIHDCAGRLLGALDISGDHRGYHRHTLGLVRSAARMIEHRLFDTRHAGGLRLRLHAQSEGIGTVAEGLVALAEDGLLTGANAVALDMLGLAWIDIGRTTLDALLAVNLPTLQDWCRRPSTTPRVVHTAAGRAFWMRVEAGRHTPSPLTPDPVEVRPSPLGGAAMADALAALDTGDAVLRAAIERARKVMGKPIALLLQGESGVGKEVFARAVHASGPRCSQPFVAVNCAALPENLIEAELFGYSPGAYTGARREGAPGRIREAQGGTLFLDEIGDMALPLQARLLRVLQERQVVPLGGGKPVAVDFALICATHRQLPQEMQSGRFREDLYYRLNGLTLQLPALRERSDLDHLLEQQLRDTLPERELQVAPDLLQALRGYRWPGNVRQLANALRTACALLDDHETVIGWTHLPDDLAQALRQVPEAAARAARDEADPDLREVSRRTIERILGESQGNLSEASRRLGISRNTLYRKLRGKV
ncbi:sigma-54-dependent Fis family transcriptional regulator [Polaromonas sp.]|uniref:sigma-54-dependent Fis family transcriptional regulator n=1 Tax=Polaromonas sp. TaxID=1869339 RepID=UPI002FC5FBFC